MFFIFPLAMFARIFTAHWQIFILHHREKAHIAMYKNYVIRSRSLILYACEAQDLNLKVPFSPMNYQDQAQKYFWQPESSREPAEHARPGGVRSWKRTRAYGWPENMQGLMYQAQINLCKSQFDMVIKSEHGQIVWMCKNIPNICGKQKPIPEDMRSVSEPEFPRYLLIMWCMLCTCTDKPLSV